MKLEEVYHIDPHALQAGIDGTTEFYMAKILRRDFGGDKHPITHVANGFADIGFSSIGLCRIDEQRSGFQSLPQRFGTGMVIPGSHADLGDKDSGVRKLGYDHGYCKPLRRKRREWGDTKSSDPVSFKKVRHLVT